MNSCYVNLIRDRDSCALDREVERRERKRKMGIRTAQQFLDGLRDDREVYYRGERVAVITNHPELGIAARHASTRSRSATDFNT